MILAYSMKTRTMVGADWIEAAGVLGFILLVCILMPDFLFKKKDNQYFFKSHGYFERFLK